MGPNSPYIYFDPFFYQLNQCQLFPSGLTSIIKIWKGVPLSINTSKLEIGISDSRQADRLPVVDLLCSIGKRCSGDVVNISEKGVQIRYQGKRDYAIGERLGLALRKAEALLLVEATVVWIEETHPNEYLAGFQFDVVGNNENTTLQELISDTG